MTRSTTQAVLLAATLVLLLIGWRLLGAYNIVTAERLYSLIDALGSARGSAWLVLAVMAGYATLLLLMFPLTILVVATGLVFGSYWGLFYATIGTLASSALSFWVGHWMGREALARMAGRRMTQAARYFSERGTRTMIVINFLPIAPFTVTNLLAGAFGLSFSRYMIGSAIGIVPGLAAVTVLGSQVGTLLVTADPADWLTPVAIASVCVGVLVLLPRLARRYWNRS